MSNIEPTEEQKQAASRFCATLDEHCSMRLSIACLLAEREAKLREGAKIDSNRWHQAAIAAQAERDTLRARVADLENSLAACRGTLFADDRYSEAREAQHLARIAELEASVAEIARQRITETQRRMSAEASYQDRVAELEEIAADLRGDIESDTEKHEREVEALTKRVAELEAVFAAATNARVADTMVNLEREAQHLADIKALKAKRLEDMREAARWGAEISANVGDEIGDNVDDYIDDTRIAADIMEEFAIIDAGEALLARLAHYDDAKADAPVCHSCEKPSPTTAFDADAGRPMCAACRGVEADPEGGAR